MLPPAVHGNVGKSCRPNFEDDDEEFNSDDENSEEIAAADSEDNAQAFSSELVPKVGMTFNSEDDAYQCDTLSSKSALLSRKMISVALKCAISKEVLQHLDDGFDKLTLEVENLLSQMNLNEKEAPQRVLKCTQEVAEERISFRVPPHKKGPMLERSKSVLEGGKKNGSSKKKGGNKNAPRNKGKKDDSRQTSAADDPRQPLSINLAGTSQLTYGSAQRQITSNATVMCAPLTTRNMMVPFDGDNSMIFFPPVQGEFTNLLLQAHHEMPAARRLDFEN